MDHLYTTQFAQAISTPAMPSSHQLSTPPPTIDPASTTIKMEDLQAAFDTPAPPPSNASSAGSPAPEGRQAKKRKSWGQVLPEPKTNLPPRKRAKTEDEKEQRRIERVKRNRLAAHNSRERKRQEYETLQAEKDKLEHDLKTARLAMARMTAELNVYRQKYPGEVPESTFEHLTPVSEYDSFLSATSDTVNPAQTTSTSFPSPVSMTMDSMDSPRDSSCQPETPDFSETAADFDQTRYPAEILCDLQCQSKALAPIDSLFDFDQFPDTTNNNTVVDSASGLVDTDVFFSSAIFGQADLLHPYGLSDPLDAKHFDLQTASGATLVSDEALAAEQH
ncbi:hypothetical protein BU26DRAFT_440549 [Trematosphaeria pertusa]|uniref:BZIP domain-containing protein n=1 Tax=Trematosphaeria pertusa TaxID=390896 RepID=A0A6A6HW48_9PLEO|nr:uncharacterized protein BU26DRAFT_440549 [Trematosphaeria pertusa]KAF2241630.1 hypothetical protein BU26DRAFT_440549 [Trematosphaeria pertusa]